MKRTFFRLLNTLGALAVSALMLIVSVSVSHAQAHRAPVPTLNVANVSMMEGHVGNTMLSFTFQLSYAPEHVVTLKYETADDTAIHGQDYIGTFGTLTIQPGQTSASRSIYIIGDTDYEDDEMVILYVYNVEGAYSPPFKAVLTIQNDDPRPAETYITVDDPQVKEGVTYNHMVFTITRSGELNRTTQLSFSTADGTATAGVDYAPWSNLYMSFNAGDTTRSVEVVIKGDKDVEPDETLILHLTTSESYTTLLKSQGVGTILNDDTGVLPTVSISDAQLIEGDSGESMMNFTVTMTPESDERTEVRAEIVDQTAAKFYDYAGDYDDLIYFLPGETVKTFSVEIKGDTDFEPDETFLVELYNPWNLTIDDGQAVGTILNDDDDTSFAVTHFSLINAANDRVLIEDFQGGTLDLVTLGRAKKLTIQAHVNGDEVGSVRFALNNKPKFRTDSAAPYTLGKNKKRDLKPWPYKVGVTYTLTATPFSGKRASGEMGFSDTITFTIVKSSSTSNGGDSTAIPTTSTLDGLPQNTRLLAVPPAP